MVDFLDKLITKESGQVLLEIDHVVYNVTPLETLDENLKSCLPSHRDVLLDVRNYLFKKGM